MPGLESGHFASSGEACEHIRIAYHLGSQLYYETQYGGLIAWVLYQWLLKLRVAGKT